ncbi:MAG: CHAT domain-containing protein [candidate division KSB1 bacterium]|nr:CHAT domain-containing protein [candidate division KSB1 bacterium]
MLLLVVMLSPSARAQQIPTAYWRAAQAMGEDDYPTARRLFSTMLLGKDYYFNAYWRLAECYALEGRFDQGQAFFKNLLTRGAPAGEVYSALSFLAEIQGDSKRNAEYCWQAVQHRTEFLSRHQKLIDLAPAFGLEQQVREHLTARLAKNPRDWPAQYALAYWEKSRGRLEAAMTQFAKLSAAGLTSWRVYYQWAMQLMLINKLDSAQTVVDRGLAATATINDKDGEAQLLHFKGYLFMRQGRFHSADSILSRAEQLSREIGYLTLQSDLAATISGLRLRQGRLQQALAQAKIVAEISTRLHNQYGKMQAHHYAAEAYHAMGLYEKERQERMQAYQWADSSKNESNRQIMMHNLAGVYQAVGDHYQALAYFEEVIAFARKHQQMLYLASCLQSQAVSLAELHRFDEAEKHYEEALTIARKGDLKELECGILLNFAGLWQKRDNWNMVEKAAATALSLARRAQLKTGVIEALVQLGEAELHNRQVRQAEEHFREAQRLSAEAGFYLPLIASMNGLGRIAAASGNNDKAAAILSEAAALVSRRIFSEHAAATSSLLPLEKELFFALSRAYIRLHEPARALESIEQMRDLVVRRRLQQSGLFTYTALADSFRQQGARLDTLLLQKRLQLARLMAADSASDKMIQLRLEIAGLELRQNQLWEKIGLAAGKNFSAYTSLQLSSFQQELAKRQEVALVYLVGEDGVLILALDGETIQAHELEIKKTELQALISQVNPALHYALQDSQHLQLISPLLFRYQPRTASQLYQLLLAGFIDKTPGKKLLLIPDEQLHFLPFEILLTDATTDTLAKNYRQLPFALKNYTVRYASSLQAAFNQQSRHAQTPATVVALAQAMPRLDNSTNGFADLWQTRSEVLKIRKILGRAAVEIVEGPFSTGTEWRNDLRQSAILHFAVHSEAQNAEPLSSRIILEERETGSTSLYAFEIFAMHLPDGRLAFLSSCNTASGVLRGSEGLQGFVQAFRAAGIPSVIGSLWPAEAEASSRLAAEFYRHLRGGESAAEALRRAKLALLETDKSLPFFWAAFQYYGVDQTFRFRQGLDMTPFAAVILAALILGAIRRFRWPSSRSN